MRLISVVTNGINRRRSALQRRGVWGRGLCLIQDIATLLLSVVVLPILFRNDHVVLFVIAPIVLCTFAVGAFYIEYRRKPRREVMRFSMLILTSLTGCFLIMIGFFVSAPEQMGGGEMILPFAVLAALAAVGAGWSFVRWRRLRADAEVRLWQLRTLRRKKNIN